MKQLDIAGYDVPFFGTKCQCLHICTAHARLQWSIRKGRGIKTSPQKTWSGLFRSICLGGKVAEDFRFAKKCGLKGQSQDGTKRRRNHEE